MSKQASVARPAVIVVSSHVVRGSVGNRAAVFALETLGHPVWAVPTVVLAWHPGHGSATRIVPPLAGFSALLADLERAPWLEEVGAVLSGYLGEAGQAAAVASLVGAVKAKNPASLYLCDPVIGDTGGLYVPQGVAAAIRDTLLPLADIATPNRFELEWLTGRSAGDLVALPEAAGRLGPRTVLVTSAPAREKGRTGNFLATRQGGFLAGHEAVKRPPNGLGDLTAAVFLARLLGNESEEAALKSTTASVFDILEQTLEDGADELRLEAGAGKLARPKAVVTVTACGPAAAVPEPHTAAR